MDQEDEDEDEDEEEEEEEEGRSKAAETPPVAKFYDTDTILACRDQLHSILCDAAPALVAGGWRVTRHSRLCVPDSVKMPPKWARKR